jgi:hypothetical protein
MPNELDMDVPVVEHPPAIRLGEADPAAYAHGFGMEGYGARRAGF